jgi:magnesium chelatase subunit I
MSSLPKTLGDLDPTAFPARSVRDEVRSNLIQRIRAGKQLFPGIVGYEDTVEPQVVNALLARHDLILLGLRGQAKTRLCRLIADLLDPAVPVIPGSPLREHPLAPLTSASRKLVAEAGPDLELEWLSPEQRYGEKLATPDVSMADLIGDIDPLKAAHRKLDLSDEEVIHYGIIPRTNRGIFTINEVPDLAPRIQVGLLNVLEEQDIQIRGFPLRLPLDVLMLFTANPEDYTNRGSIITPLKDRIASQIITHYPRTLDEAKHITADQAWTDRGELPEVSLSTILDDCVEEVAFRGRESEFIDQKSGVSARLPIAVRELVISNAERRLIRHDGAAPQARLVDLTQVVPAITGKVELVYEGEQEGVSKVATHLVGDACRATFDRLFPEPLEGDGGDTYQPVLAWFSQGNDLELADDEDDKTYAGALESVPGLGELVAEHLPEATGSERLVAMELVLEGLHRHNLLSKMDRTTGAVYADMLKVMMEDLRR